MHFNAYIYTKKVVSIHAISKCAHKFIKKMYNYHVTLCFIINAKYSAKNIRHMFF